jgi:hypothetical protein
MTALENILTEAVLKRIRSRRVAQSEGNTASATDLPARADAAVKIREAQFADCERVCALNLRLGQGPDSPENWNRLWRDNPAITHGNATPRIGWVLEDSRETVGFLGSIPLLYEYNGKTLIAAATCRLAVEPAYRAFSHLLLTSFFRQKDVDLFLNNTATVAAGKMMTALKAVELPQKDYDTVLFWILDSRPFAKAALKRMGLGPSLASVGGVAASLVLEGDTAIRSRRPKSKIGSFTVSEMDVSEMGPEFLELWSRKQNQLNLLMAKRSQEIMRWHFEPPGNRRIARVLSCSSQERLLGYLIVLHEEETKGGLRRSFVADFLLRDEDPQVADALLAAACQSSKRAGSHILEVMGFPGTIRNKFLRWKPYSRKYPACPFFFKARDRALHEALMNETAWYASPFDGDSTLWP